jgi:DNA-binding LytR/AlgR family response regulator
MLAAGSGAAGLQVLELVEARGGQVGLVLADSRLPHMTGIELLTKAHGLDPAAKRALLTGWGDRLVGGHQRLRGTTTTHGGSRNDLGADHRSSRKDANATEAHGLRC